MKVKTRMRNTVGDNDDDDEDEGLKKEKRRNSKSQLHVWSRSEWPRIPKFYRQNAANREESASSLKKKKK